MNSDLQNEVEQARGRGQSLQQFVALGMESLASARRSGEYVDGGEVIRRLTVKLESAKKRRSQSQAAD